LRIVEPPLSTGERMCVNDPLRAGRAREKRTFGDFAARPLAVIDGVSRLLSFRDEGAR